MENQADAYSALCPSVRKSDLARVFPHRIYELGTTANTIRSDLAGHPSVNR